MMNLRQLDKVSELCAQKNGIVLLCGCTMGTYRFITGNCEKMPVFFTVNKSLLNCGITECVTALAKKDTVVYVSLSADSVSGALEVLRSCGVSAADESRLVRGCIIERGELCDVCVPNSRLARSLASGNISAADIEYSFYHYTNVVSVVRKNLLIKYGAAAADTEVKNNA